MIDDNLRSFSFRRRPIPVPGDLRIGWRIATILLMLGYSRSSKASLAKLYILNDVVRSGNYTAFETILKANGKESAWSPQVEPAFARAIDYLIGERLASWTKASGRAALQLTAAGVKAATSVAALDGILVRENAFFKASAKDLSEALVTTLTSQAKRAA